MDTFTYDTTISKDVKNKIETYGGILVNDHLELTEDQINWNTRENQPRAADTDKGHISALQADILSKGLQNKPLVEWNESIEKYEIVSGFHRTQALRNLVDKYNQGKFVFGEVSFDDIIKKEFFKQVENDHRPQKPHGKKDAALFLKNMRKHGFFKSANGDKALIENKVMTLLAQHYPRLNKHSRRDVFVSSFADLNLSRVITAHDKDIKKLSKKTFGKNTQFYVWDNNEYYCSATPDNSRKVIASALEKRVRAIDNKKASRDNRGKLNLVVNFPTTKCSTPAILQRYRQDFVDTELLMNRLAWTGAPIIINKIIFAPQISGAADVTETNFITYKWDYEHQQFVTM